MKSPEQTRKIENVILYVLQKFDNGLDCIKLFDIVYFAQQDYLCRFAKSIIPETFKLNEHGPILEETDKVIKNIMKGVCGDSIESHSFEKSIEIVDGKIFAIKHPELDFFAVKEREGLDKWCGLCKNKNSSDLSKKFQDTEYRNIIEMTKIDLKQAVLTNVDIARLGHASDDVIDYIREKEILVAALS